MKARQLTYAALYLSCTLAVLTACTSNEDPLTPKEKTPVGITTTITGEVVTKTVPEDKTYTPTDANNEKIYLYYEKGDNTKQAEKGVFTYNSVWKSPDLPSTDAILWDDLAPVNISGDNKYPFFAVAPVDLANATTGAVEADQSTSAQANLIKSDLLMAYTDATTQKGTVALTFKHMLAKLTVKVKVGTVNGFNSSEVKIKNAIKDYTVGYTNPTTAAPATITTAVVGVNSVTATELTPFAGANEGSNESLAKVYSVILPAQNVSSTAAKVEIKITVGSSPQVVNTYTFQPEEAITLVNGTHTTLTLTIKGTKVELGDVKVTDWADESQNGDITIDQPSA